MKKICVSVYCDSSLVDIPFVWKRKLNSISFLEYTVFP